MIICGACLIYSYQKSSSNPIIFGLYIGIEGVYRRRRVLGCDAWLGVGDPWLGVGDPWLGVGDPWLEAAEGGLQGFSLRSMASESWSATHGFASVATLASTTPSGPSSPTSL